MRYSDKEAAALDTKLAGRRPYIGNSGDVKVTGRLTKASYDFTRRERQILRAQIQDSPWCVPESHTTAADLLNREWFEL